jgi:hypothetical protein
MVAVVEEHRPINCKACGQTHQALLHLNSKGVMAAGFRPSRASLLISYTCPVKGQLMQVNLEFTNLPGQKIKSAQIVGWE